MNARQEEKAVLAQLQTLARYSLGLYTYGELDAALERLEAKRKVHRAAEGDGWTLWKLGKE